MCGIARIVRFDRDAVKQDVLRRMADALTHRGRDGGGIYAAGPCGFAHRRLGIIDPACGAQPLIDRKSGLSLTYNGEVYNFIEIRRKLGEAGLATVSDTELVLRGWRRWGTAALDRFEKLEAGHYPEIDFARGSVLKNWLERRHTKRLKAECLEELEALLREIIGLYVRSDVPFGAFLSGGVDSNNTVTALMSEAPCDPVRSFSIGFAESEYSELTYAQEAATRLGTRHHAAVLDRTVSLRWLLSLGARFGEPFADSSCIPTSYVSHVAAIEVKIVLSGEGGRALSRLSKLSCGPRVDWRADGSRFRLCAAVSWSRGALSGRTRGQRKHWTATHHRRSGTRSQQRSTKRSLEGSRPPSPMRRSLLRMSMDNALEVRVPLLDHKLD